MEKNEKALDLILQQGVLPLFYHPNRDVCSEVLRSLYRAGIRANRDVCSEVLRSLYRAGIRAVEFTNRGEAAVDNFLFMRGIVENELEGMLLGVGTIKNKMHVTEFVNEGADFIVSPGLIEDVADIASRNDVLWVPGCMTSTEIIQAEEMGASLIKLFPGSLLGPSYVTAIREIFPDLLFMPTGGVEANEENLSAWFKAGVSAVGLGSRLISNDVLERNDYTSLEAATRKLIEMVNRVRSF
jgi:2-dehydro-3-deoxyphosphogluconate aldolase / (4S)-4-hydroxy-2-oxoglutarate aldolase